MEWLQREHNFQVLAVVAICSMLLTLLAGCGSIKEDEVVIVEFMGFQYEVSEQEERILTHIRDEKEMNFILYINELNAFEYNREVIFEMIADVVREETNYNEFIFVDGSNEALNYRGEGVVVIYPVVWGRDDVAEVIYEMNTDEDNTFDNVRAAAFLNGFDYQPIFILIGDADPLIVPLPTTATLRRVEALNIYFMIETAGLDVITMFDEVGLDVFLDSDVDYNVNLPRDLEFPIDLHDILEVEDLKYLWFTEFTSSMDVAEIDALMRELERLRDE